MGENAPGKAAPAVGGATHEEQQIVDRIFTAVMEQRLPPSTKLSEAKLCETFGVGRMRVRRALLLLANQGIVVLHANRGAFVACPTRKEAHDVFGARLAVEPSVVRQVAERGTPPVFARLAEHIALEQASRNGRKRRDVIRLSGEFHVKLAEATDNAVLARMVRELVTRTSLIIGLFGTSGASSCKEDEHRLILEALRQHDASTAERLLRAHLAHIQADIDPSSAEPEDTDLIGLLGER